MKKENKLKILLPTLREKDRYISFQVISEEPIEYSDLEPAILNTFLDFYGEYGFSKLSFWIIKNLYDLEKQIGVIRCNNKSVQQTVAGLGLVSRLGETRITIKIFKISGTIKGLKL
jgi:ribonuclease P/MRP protein subunit POP5